MADRGLRRSTYTHPPGASKSRTAIRSSTTSSSSESKGGSRKISCHGPIAVRKNFCAGASTTCAVAPSIAALRLSAPATLRLRSTSTTSAAPRDIASRPSAPLPAYRSRQWASWTSATSQLNRLPRTRLSVGRNPVLFGKRSFRPFHLPPIMRTSLLAIGSMVSEPLVADKSALLARENSERAGAIG